MWLGLREFDRTMLEDILNFYPEFVRERGTSLIYLITSTNIWCGQLLTVPSIDGVPVQSAPYKWEYKPGDGGGYVRDQIHPENGRSKLVYPLQGENMIEVFLNRGVNVNGRFNGWTHLYTAAWSGNIEIAKLLLMRGADIDALSGENRASPLFVAVSRWFYNMVELLLEYKPNIELRSRDRTPLWLACKES